MIKHLVVVSNYQNSLFIENEVTEVTATRTWQGIGPNAESRVSVFVLV